MTAKPILVLGSTGKTGARILQRLSAQGRPVRAGSRQSPTPFDWEDRNTWDAALEGVSAVYISYYPDLAAPGAAEAITELTARAERAGVERLVLLSGRGEEVAQQCERIVQASAIPSTIVRASWFAQNFSESFLLDAVLSGTVALPARDIGEPFIDVDDIADVAVAALTQPGHAGRLYEVTGPRLLTFRQAVAEIADAAGLPLQYVQITPEEYQAGMAEAGVPEEVGNLVLYLFDTVLDGRNAQTADGVQQALGRPPRDFADYARRAAAAGAWAQAAVAV